MPEEEHLDPPTNVREIGIHIGYMRKDIRALTTTVQDIPKSFVSVKDHQELVDRVASLERKNGLKNTLQWVGLSVTTIISVIALYNLFTQ